MSGTLDTSYESCPFELERDSCAERATARAAKPGPLPRSDGLIPRPLTYISLMCNRHLSGFAIAVQLLATDRTVPISRPSVSDNRLIFSEGNGRMDQAGSRFVFILNSAISTFPSRTNTRCASGEIAGFRRNGHEPLGLKAAPKGPAEHSEKRAYLLEHYHPKRLD